MIHELFAIDDDRRHALPVVEVLRYYGPDTLGPARALVLVVDHSTGSPTSAIVVPLDRLAAVAPQPDRVLLPAVELGDLVATAEQLLEQLRANAHPRGVRTLRLMHALEHALTAAVERARTLEPWEVL